MPTTIIDHTGSASGPDNVEQPRTELGTLAPIVKTQDSSSLDKSENIILSPDSNLPDLLKAVENLGQNYSGLAGTCLHYALSLPLKYDGLTEAQLFEVYTAFASIIAEHEPAYAAKMLMDPGCAAVSRQASALGFGQKPSEIGAEVLEVSLRDADSNVARAAAIATGALLDSKDAAVSEKRRCSLILSAGKCFLEDSAVDTDPALADRSIALKQLLMKHLDVKTEEFLIQALSRTEDPICVLRAVGVLAEQNTERARAGLAKTFENPNQAAVVYAHLVELAPKQVTAIYDLALKYVNAGREVPQLQSSLEMLLKHPVPDSVNALSGFILRANPSRHIWDVIGEQLRAAPVPGLASAAVDILSPTTWAGKLWSSIGPYLAPFIHSEQRVQSNSERQLLAVEILNRSDHPEKIPALEKALGSGRENVWHEAMYGLGPDNPKAKPIFIRELLGRPEHDKMSQFPASLISPLGQTIDPEIVNAMELAILREPNASSVYTWSALMQRRAQEGKPFCLELATQLLSGNYNPGRPNIDSNPKLAKLFAGYPELSNIWPEQLKALRVHFALPILTNPSVFLKHREARAALEDVALNLNDPLNEPAERALRTIF